MKITFVLDTFGGGGKERRCLQLIQGLNKKGYNDIQVIIVNNDVGYKELHDTNIKLYILDRKNKDLNFFDTYEELSFLIKEFNPDIVQVWGILSTFYLNFIKPSNNFKFIGSYVADCNKLRFFSVGRMTILLNILLADCIIGNSKAGIKAYNIPSRKAKVIYNGFNEKRYDNKSLDVVQFKDALNLRAGNIVSMVARIDNNKDQKTFIEAAKIILKERNDVDFLIVGEGEDLKDLRIGVNQKESENIHFLGFRPDVENILQITDISILCTNPLKHKEGVSNAILESLAFGVPVIATNDGGTPEIVESGINGYLINAFDPFELKSNIIKILNDKALKNILSINAMKIVKDKFSLDKMTNKYIELYENLIQ
jgi:glycosyltransferase involved in cell wall biosynthesis